MEDCAPKNQKGYVAMWLWSGRKSWKKSGAMEKVLLNWKQNLYICVAESEKN